MDQGKLVSGIAAFAIYMSLIYIVLYFYNNHQVKAKNYVEKNADRVTVTLVNSDKTVFNKKDKVTEPKKPIPQVVPPVPLKHPQPKNKSPKKEIPKKTPPKKQPPKKEIPKKVVPKKYPPKKEIPKKVVPKKTPPKKQPPKKEVPKKVVPKKVPPKKQPPKKTPPKKTPSKTAKDLFSSVKTKEIKKQPVKRTPKPPVKQPSSVKHNSSVTDRIKATHQSGRVSNANRERGIENAYIAKVKRHMMNWNAVGARGQMVSIRLTIFNSGKFRYTASGVSGPMMSSLRSYLDQLNRMGLGRHQKSTPYSIRVDFRVR
ncbi:MAG TPA: hypothetical protein ENK82_03690 [Campylobacterales bacterium]|nr:hypothetical protein [Campylobacterales bacterium]HHS92423.1 hypothetical protein [Campylobacterales bacterium]